MFVRNCSPDHSLVVYEVQNIFRDRKVSVTRKLFQIPEETRLSVHVPDNHIICYIFKLTTDTSPRITCTTSGRHTSKKTETTDDSHVTDCQLILFSGLSESLAIICTQNKIRFTLKSEYDMVLVRWITKNCGEN